MTEESSLSLFMHQYGGIYSYQGIALDTSNSIEVVVYRHIYPFEEKLFTRPLEEFEDKTRFKPISLEVFQDILLKNSKKEYQEFVAQNKKNKKSCFQS